MRVSSTVTGPGLVEIKSGSLTLWINKHRLQTYVRCTKETHMNEARSLASKCLKSQRVYKNYMFLMTNSGNLEKPRDLLKPQCSRMFSAVKIRPLQRSGRRTNNYRKALPERVAPAVLPERAPQAGKGPYLGGEENTCSVVMVTRNHQFKGSASVQHQHSALLPINDSSPT